jgi:hypothetical protein
LISINYLSVRKSLSSVQIVARGPQVRGGTWLNFEKEMETIYYTFTAILLYVISDWLLQRLEITLGRRFEYRSLYFFFIILILALPTFAAIRHLIS